MGQVTSCCVYAAGRPEGIEPQVVTWRWGRKPQLLVSHPNSARPWASEFVAKTCGIHFSWKNLNHSFIKIHRGGCDPKS